MVERAKIPQITMRDFSLIKECLGYVTAPEETNTDERTLITGSQNVLIDRQRKVRSRGGYTRLGAANSALTAVRQAATWNSSTGLALPMRVYDDELEVYLGTVDGTVINAWTRVASGLSTTETPRFATWWDTGENLDLLLWVIGDDNMYEWGGGVAQVLSITGTTVTKAGTNTFAQNRFYTARNLTFICVRTGTEYTYTGGAGTTTLTGIADTTGLVAGDTLVQKIVTQSNKPAADRNNDTIFSFENQIFVGSFDDNEVFISQNDDYDDFTYSAPRAAGEGGLLTLDGPSGGFGALSNNVIAFAGRNSIFKAKYLEITVSTTLAETLTVEKLKSGVNQASQSPDCVVQVGNAIAYLSYEPALRLLEQPEDIEGPQLKTLSNPIKPDFDAETWTNAQSIWWRNALYLSAPTNSKLYILEFMEDADGMLRRFWNPPQILPVRTFSIISENLYIHSNSVAESYKLFDGFSDVNSDDDKIPIYAIAKFAYRNFKNRVLLKNFDEFLVEGGLSPSTSDLLMTVNYDFGGYTQQLQKTINGSDEDIMLEPLPGSGLGQEPLAQQPLGGASEIPSDSRKFRVIFEIAREDFHEMNVKFETNEIDRFWSIFAHGPNAVLSPRKPIAIKK